ncbi:unnamed protein product [Clonostachys rosea]|uniref:Uncharacterized protein n=1 Tax=Bionectria ochroleuca TaxID=29856 RepID=A0ABY6U2L6_BIOOC|nr:unnamed protein product [Clonostachys rosea]
MGMSGNIRNVYLELAVYKGVINMGEAPSQSLIGRIDDVTWVMAGAFPFPPSADHETTVNQ